ncbi:MAG: hypothetical protein K8S97_15420 [Anaerolineae bacterium]|nr:hypothetical protein [Anaerolineae bacterium]
MQGYLVTDGNVWQLPAYAQEMLWLSGGAQPVQLRGSRGVFMLEHGVAPNTDALTLTWGHANGPLLAHWPLPANADHPLALDWRGVISVGGFVERLHALEVRGLTLVVAEVEGALLLPDHTPLPTLDQMRKSSASRADTAIAPETPEFTYSLIALADTVLAEYLHHALVSELAIDVRAVLAPQDGRWHEIVGLPLLVEMVSLLSPGAR